MQIMPDQQQRGFMDDGADPGAADPGTQAAAPSADPSDPSADPTQGGFMQDGNDPAGDDANLAGVQHGASMGGADSQHPGSDAMLSQDDTQVSPDEQRAYDDFVTRALLFISDTRKPLGKNRQPNTSAKAPADIIIDHLNVKGLPADQAVGRTTAQVCWLIFTNAKHQNVDYPPDVLYHGADEVMSHIYEIGVRSGAIKNPPPPNSPQEQKLLGMAKMYACQYFGNNVIDSGMNDQDAARAFYQQQIKREADTGGLDNWSPHQVMSPTQLTNYMARAAQGKGSLASMRKGAPSTIQDFKSQGHPSIVPPGGAPQPPQAAPADDGSGQDDGSGDDGSGGDQTDPNAEAQQ
jgi:hypothetical protein